MIKLMYSGLATSDVLTADGYMLNIGETFSLLKCYLSFSSTGTETASSQGADVLLRVYYECSQFSQNCQHLLAIQDMHVCPQPKVFYLSSLKSGCELICLSPEM